MADLIFFSCNRFSLSLIKSISPYFHSMVRQKQRRSCIRVWCHSNLKVKDPYSKAYHILVLQYEGIQFVNLILYVSVVSLMRPEVLESRGHNLCFFFLKPTMVPGLLMIPSNHLMS